MPFVVVDVETCSVDPVRLNLDEASNPQRRSTIDGSIVSLIAPCFILRTHESLLIRCSQPTKKLNATATLFTMQSLRRVSRHSSRLFRQQRRCFGHSIPRLQGFRNENLEVELSAPTKQTWKQPVGLFIGNEFVSATGADEITSINPT